MITIFIKYKGKGDNPRLFMEEMVSSGIVDEIRKEEGNLRYEYYLPVSGGNEVILIDSWADQNALDRHHALPLMKKISELRSKYDLHMEMEKYKSLDDDGRDERFIRR